MSDPLHNTKTTTPAATLPGVPRPRPRFDSEIRERAPARPPIPQLLASPVVAAAHVAPIVRAVPPMPAKAGPPPLPVVQPIAKAGPPPLPTSVALTRATPPPLPTFAPAVPVEVARTAWQQASDADDVPDFLNGAARRRRVIWTVLAVAVVALLVAFGVTIASHFRPT